MAADSGNLTGNDIVSIGGSGRGVDTALILKPANQSDLSAFGMCLYEKSVGFARPIGFVAISGWYWGTNAFFQIYLDECQKLLPILPVSEDDRAKTSG